MVQFVDMVLKGGEFYRDATIYPLPGSFYFLVLVFKLFGAPSRIGAGRTLGERRGRSSAVVVQAATLADALRARREERRRA